jgi:hypothetical protein
LSLEHSPARIGKRAPAAQSIREFCADNGICTATYYNLRKRGLGPDETRFGERGQLVLITAESAQKWRRKFTSKGVARPRQRKTA